MYDRIEAPAPRNSIFNRMSTVDKTDKGTSSQPSVFNRLGTTKEVDEKKTSWSRKSVFARLGDMNTSPRKGKNKRSTAIIELNSTKKDYET